MVKHEIPKDHPRYESLITRERIIQGMHDKIVAEAGLLAAGRGEAFDYLLGEKTPDFALQQERLGVIYMLLAKHPVISINGNVAVLCPQEIVTLAKVLQADLEINLFYRTKERELAIMSAIEQAGGKNILGVHPDHQTTIPEITHQRRVVDSRGIAVSDCVFVPLEDGDRTQALKKLGKEIITVDLNPISRTSLAATVSITNNITRAIPEMISIAKKLQSLSEVDLEKEKEKLSNKLLLEEGLLFMSTRLSNLSSELLKKME